MSATIPATIASEMVKFVPATATTLVAKAFVSIRRDCRFIAVIYRRQVQRALSNPIQMRARPQILRPVGVSTDRRVTARSEPVACDETERLLPGPERSRLVRDEPVKRRLKLRADPDRYSVAHVEISFIAETRRGAQRAHSAHAALGARDPDFVWHACGSSHYLRWGK